LPWPKPNSTTPSRPCPKNHLSPTPAATLIDPLTERELEVLPLLAQGLTNRQIADRLTVVLGTVKAHNNSIYSKLGVSNRVQALTRARELGLIR
jgi:LuxR family transcriptional regulator, maltose regulon positive regulatory protein